jgi:hypothetical protein
MPNAKGEQIAPKPIITDPIAKKSITLEAKLAKQGFNNIYKHYHLRELERVIASENIQSEDERKLIQLYIEMGGYQYND